jgi:hypothetical protein
MVFGHVLESSRPPFACIKSLLGGRGSATRSVPGEVA